MYLKASLILVFYLYWCNIESEAAPKKWPSKYPRCHRDDPNINKCMLEATEIIKPYLKKGLPEFRIAPISPFVIPKVMVQQGTNSLNYKVTFTNMNILGFDSYHFEKFDFDLKKLQFDAVVNLGTLNVTTNYDVIGKILTVPVEGNGTMSGYILGASGSVQLKVKTVTKAGTTYLTPSGPPTIQLKIGKVTDYNIGGLFDQNEVLAKAARAVIDDNVEVLVEEVKPAVVKVIGEILTDILKKSTSDLPYDEVFPVSNKT